MQRIKRDRGGEVKEFIFKTLQHLAAIPSLSGQEDKLHAALREYFCTEDYVVSTVERSMQVDYTLVVPTVMSSKYLFCIHTDRVPDFRTRKAYETSIVFEEDVFTGQLDNVISIALVLYFATVVQPINILFTTREETLESWSQIRDVVMLYRGYGVELRPISIDVDVFQQFSSGGDITLRTEDVFGQFNMLTGALLRSTAQSLGLSWLGNSEGRAACEVGALCGNTKGILNGMHVGLPMLNHHTDREQVRWMSVYNTLQLLRQLLENEKIEKASKKVGNSN